MITFIKRVSAFPRLSASISYHHEGESMVNIRQNLSLILSRVHVRYKINIEAVLGIAPRIIRITCTRYFGRKRERRVIRVILADPGELRVQFEYDWSRALLNRTWMDTRSYEERVGRGTRDKTKVEAASRPRAFHVYSLRRRNAWRWRVATRYRCWRRLSLKPDDNVVMSVGESLDDKSRESDDDRCWEITRELEPTNTNEGRIGKRFFVYYLWR